MRNSFNEMKYNNPQPIDYIFYTKTAAANCRKIEEKCKKENKAGVLRFAIFAFHLLLRKMQTILYPFCLQYHTH